MITKDQVVYENVVCPDYSFMPEKVDLTAATMEARRKKLLAMMKKEKLDAVIIYADREHGDNFKYLTGFAPRFEEALLSVLSDGQAYLFLGNEMLRMQQFSRLEAKAIHTPYFSLPNQPMGAETDLKSLLQMGELKKGSGWRL